MSQITRRTLLKGTLLTGAAALLPSSRVLGANDDIRVAVVGFNGQGMGHVNTLLDMKGVRLVALCDVDPAVLARGVETAGKKGVKVEGYADVRKLLESNEIDAITTATPNHWHSLIGIWACQAGKDAYVEKPISHNVWEGRRLVEAARHYGRVVQGGTQNRANGRIRAAVRWVNEGNLGKIRVVTGYCYKPRQSIGSAGRGTIPAGLDYDLWTGPAPKKELARAKLHYDWHWVYDTGNGDMGNQGIHQMDVARWFLGVNEISPRVMSIGGRLGYDDDGETPNTQVVYHDYDKAPLIFETRGLPKAKEFHDPKEWGRNMDYPGIGVIVECEGGKVVVNGGVNVFDKEGKKMPAIEAEEGGNHIGNWIDAVRAKKAEKLYAESLETHLSSALCHTGLISHLLGKTMSSGEILERIQSDKVAAERFELMKDHLGKNGVDLTSTPLTLGPWLTCDPKKERFVDNKAANALLTREYRAPYTVPKKF